MGLKSLSSVSFYWEISDKVVCTTFDNCFTQKLILDLDKKNIEK
jgi:hypothetical protein